MPTFDPIRTNFVKSAYRVRESADPSILAKIPTAGTQRIDTTLSAADAQDIADIIQAEAGKNAQAFDIELKSTLRISDLAGAIKLYTYVSERFGLTDLTRKYRLYGFVNDHARGVVMLRVRG